jgi:hypothetical protein
MLYECFYCYYDDLTMMVIMTINRPRALHERSTVPLVPLWMKWLLFIDIDLYLSCVSNIYAPTTRHLQPKFTRRIGQLILPKYEDVGEAWRPTNMDEHEVWDG